MLRSKNSLILIIVFILLNLQACVDTAVNNNADNNAQLAADDNVQLGLAYLEQDDVARAKGKLLMALQQAPSWYVTQDAMGYFLETTGDNQAAEKYYLQALQAAPKNGAALNNYGVFLCRTKRPLQAEQLFLKAINDPNYLNTAEVYENAGLCALTMPTPDKTKAKYYFTKALQEDPKRSVAQMELSILAGNT